MIGLKMLVQKTFLLNRLKTGSGRNRYTAYSCVRFVLENLLEDKGIMHTFTPLEGFHKAGSHFHQETGPVVLMTST